MVSGLIALIGSVLFFIIVALIAGAIRWAGGRATKHAWENREEYKKKWEEKTKRESDA
jgi:hypothetical protein